mmetsp:Transcript_35305/g.82494  ORF Transcript_35305/g.82494 Transcript_35305/m.82494 type:complete len:158 (+) Transcript_35305:195-668(+)
MDYDPSARHRTSKMADWDLEGWFAGLCMVCDRSAKKEVIPRVVSSLLDRRDCPGGSVVSPIPILRRSSTSSPTPANTSPHAPFMPSKDDTPKHVMLMLVRMNATELAEEGDFLAMHLKTLQSEGNPFSEKDHAIQLRWGFLKRGWGRLSARRRGCSS